MTQTKTPLTLPDPVARIIPYELGFPLRLFQQHRSIHLLRDPNAAPLIKESGFLCRSHKSLPVYKPLHEASSNVCFRPDKCNHLGFGPLIDPVPKGTSGESLLRFDNQDQQPHLLAAPICVMTKKCIHGVGTERRCRKNQQPGSEYCVTHAPPTDTTDPGTAPGDQPSAGQPSTNGDAPIGSPVATKRPKASTLDEDAGREEQPVKGSDKPSEPPIHQTAGDDAEHETDPSPKFKPLTKRGSAPKARLAAERRRDPGSQLTLPAEGDYDALHLKRRRLVETISGELPQTSVQGIDNSTLAWCYRAAALQAILSVPRFVNWLRLRSQLHQEKGTKETQNLSYEERKMRRLCRETKSRCAACELNVFAEQLRFGDTPPMMRDLETLQLLFEQAVEMGEMEFNQCTAMPDEHGDVDEYLERLLGLLEAKEGNEKILPKEMCHALWGLLLQVSWTCPECSTTKTFRDEWAPLLRIFPPDQTEPVHLYDLFENAMRETSMPPACETRGCPRKTTPDSEDPMQREIRAAPDMLILAIQRTAAKPVVDSKGRRELDQNGRPISEPYKKHTPVQVPLEFSIDRQWAPDRPHLQQDLDYTLQAVVCHQGELGGGHIICYAKLNGQWYEFDDDEIAQNQFVPMGVETVTNPSAVSRSPGQDGLFHKGPMENAITPPPGKGDAKHFAVSLVVYTRKGAGKHELRPTVRYEESVPVPRMATTVPKRAPASQPTRPAKERSPKSPASAAGRSSSAESYRTALGKSPRQGRGARNSSSGSSEISFSESLGLPPAQPSRQRTPSLMSSIDLANPRKASGSSDADSLRSNPPSPAKARRVTPIEKARKRASSAPPSEEAPRRRKFKASSLQVDPNRTLAPRRARLDASARLYDVVESVESVEAAYEAAELEGRRRRQNFPPSPSKRRAAAYVLDDVAPQARKKRKIQAI